MGQHARPTLEGVISDNLWDTRPIPSEKKIEYLLSAWQLGSGKGSHTNCPGETVQNLSTAGGSPEGDSPGRSRAKRWAKMKRMLLNGVSSRVQWNTVNP